MIPPYVATNVSMMASNSGLSGSSPDKSSFTPSQSRATIVPTFLRSFSQVMNLWILQTGFLTIFLTLSAIASFTFWAWVFGCFLRALSCLSTAAYFTLRSSFLALRFEFSISKSAFLILNSLTSMSWARDPTVRLTRLACVSEGPNFGKVHQKSDRRGLLQCRTQNLQQGNAGVWSMIPWQVWGVWNDGCSLTGRKWGVNMSVSCRRLYLDLDEMKRMESTACQKSSFEIMSSGCAEMRICLQSRSTDSGALKKTPTIEISIPC